MAFMTSFLVLSFISITIMLSIPIKNEDFDSNLFVGFMVTTFIPYSLLILCIYVILEKEN